MPKTIAHRELRNNSSAILREVQGGETFTITNHGVPVAVIVPVGSDAASAPRIRPPRVRGKLSDLPLYKASRPSQEILDELRGDR